MMASFPYLFLILSSALSSFSCFSLRYSEFAVLGEKLSEEESKFAVFSLSGSGGSISNKLSCTGSEWRHNLEVRIPNRRMGVRFHNSSNKWQAVSYIKVVESVGVVKVVW